MDSIADCSAKRHTGEGLFWQFTLPNGEYHAYRRVGVRANPEVMDSVENLGKWILDPNGFLVKTSLTAYAVLQVFQVFLIQNKVALRDQKIRYSE